MTIHSTPKGTLFAQPTARKSDPVTSHEAAAAAKNSAATHGAVVLIRITERPGCTASEIAAVVGFDRVEVNRRTADLAKFGLIRRGDPRKSIETGRKELTWWPVDMTPDGEKEPEQ